MREKIQLYEIDLTRKKDSITEWKICDEEKEKILQFLDELELGRINKGKKICQIRISKYIQCLKVNSLRS